MLSLPESVPWNIVSYPFVTCPSHFVYFFAFVSFLPQRPLYLPSSFSQLHFFSYPKNSGDLCLRGVWGHLDNCLLQGSLMCSRFVYVYCVLSDSWQGMPMTTSCDFQLKHRRKTDYSVPRTTRLNHLLLDGGNKENGSTWKQLSGKSRALEYVALTGRMWIGGQWMCIPAFHQYYLLFAVLCLQCSGIEKVISESITTSLYPSSIFLCLYWKLNRVTFVPGASQWISRNQRTSVNQIITICVMGLFEVHSDFMVLPVFFFFLAWSRWLWRRCWA